MTDFEAIYHWLMEECGVLQECWAVSSLLDDMKNVIQPNSSENLYDVTYTPYQDGGKRYLFQPKEPYYFDVDIICYRAVYADQNDYNMDALGNVQSVCDWFIDCQNKGDTPKVTGCYQIECLTPKPFIRGEYEWEGNPGGFLVDYAITVRFYVDNPAKERVVIR